MYIGIGSNMGDRLFNLNQACLSLNQILSDIKLSSVWETKALIVEDQPLFLNMAVRGRYRGSEIDLLREVQAIEASLGRNRALEIPKGPRTMDLDILLFGDLEMNQTDLTLPHPGIKERAFVLYPLLEILNSDQPHRNEYQKALELLDHQGVECYKNPSKGGIVFE